MPQICPKRSVNKTTRVIRLKQKEKKQLKDLDTPLERCSFRKSANHSRKISDYGTGSNL